MKKLSMKNEDFLTVIDDYKKQRELKECIRMMNSQKSDDEKFD